MTGDEYRVKAADLNTQALIEPNEQIRKELSNLVLQYLRLAIQADRNGQTDIVYVHEATRPAAQQQQQIQPPEAPRKSDP
jgi:hypothetical protein